MKCKVSTFLMLLLVAPLSGFAEQLIPAGSLVSCTVSEPKLSSKTANIGDPVMCKVSHVELYGRSTLPYGSYMVGRFEDYKDPGHFVGKGWMELRFDRMVIEPDTIIPVDARVVSVPGYNVDRYGRILGKGHTTRDIIEWSIPILWPIDLLNLPRRGPRPTLKEETRLTLKILDDLGVPERQQERYPDDTPRLLHRPSSYQPTQYQEQTPPPPPQPVAQTYAPQPVYQPQPVVQTYVQYVPPPPVYYVPPPPPVYYYTPPVAVRASIPYWGYYSPY